MNNEFIKVELEIKSLEMYKKDLLKIRAAALKKREKEVIKLEAKIKNIEELNEDELQESYGYGGISKKQYERRLENLKSYEENKETFKDKPTALKLYLKLLDQDIWNIETNIKLDKEDISI